MVKRIEPYRPKNNVRIVTADVNSTALDAELGRHFDRIVSIEMMEHTRNWRHLLRRAATWLLPSGRMFVHVFTHRSVGYAFADGGGSDGGDWMARHFFTGGQMPADAQMLHFQDDMVVESHWRVSGRHYQRTAEAWLRNLDAQRETAIDCLREVHGERAPRMLNLWRVFFMACAELWGFDGGREWLVSHYLMRPRAAADRAAD